MLSQEKIEEMLDKKLEEFCNMEGFTNEPEIVKAEAVIATLLAILGFKTSDEYLDYKERQE